MNSGIYQIKNTATGMIYIGRSMRWDERRRRHISDLRGNRHKNPRLQHSWNSRPESDFEFTMIWPEAKENLEELEGMILELLFDSGRMYNSHKNANGGSLGQVWTAEQRQRHSLINKGRKCTDESKIRMSEANLSSDKCKAHLAKLLSPEVRVRSIALAATPESRAKAVATRKANGHKPFSDESRQKKKDDAKARLFLALDWAVANSATRGNALTKFNCSWGSLKLYQSEWELINGKLGLSLRASGEKSGMYKHGLSKEITRHRTPEERVEGNRQRSIKASGTSNGMYGRKHTAEAKAIQSKSAKIQADNNRKNGYVVSAETRAKQSAALRGKPKSSAAKRMSAAGQIGKLYRTPFGIFYTSKECEQATGVKAATIMWRCKNSYCDVWGYAPLPTKDTQVSAINTNTGIAIA